MQKVWIKQLFQIVFQKYYVLTDKRTGEAISLSLLGYIRDIVLLLPTWLILCSLKNKLPNDNPLKTVTLSDFVLGSKPLSYFLSIGLWFSGFLCLYCLVIIFIKGSE